MTWGTMCGLFAFVVVSIESAVPQESTDSYLLGCCWVAPLVGLAFGVILDSGMKNAHTRRFMLTTIWLSLLVAFYILCGEFTWLR